MNHKAHEPAGGLLIRNDEFLKVLPHFLHIGGHPGTVDNDNLVTGDTVKVELPGPVLRRRMKLDLVEGPSGLVTEIDITARRSPLGRYVMFQSSEKKEQAGFGHEVLVGLVRQLGEVVGPAQGIASRGPIQIGAELP